MARQLSDLIAPGEPEQIASGLQFTEGPLWHPGGYLLFSDIPADTIYRWEPGREARRYIKPSRQSNGLTFDPLERLIACEHQGRQVSRIVPGGAMGTLVNNYQGKRLNSPNDVVVHSNGSIYFTDPPYGILPDLGEIGFFGVYRVDTDGSITLLVSDFIRPNGLAFNNDESVLFVADSWKRHVLAYAVNADLSLGKPSVFADMDVAETGNPDGIKIDIENNMYVAGGGGTLAAEQVKQADPDGNTILFTHTGQLIVNEVAGLTEDSLDAFDICCSLHAAFGHADAVGRYFDCQFFELSQ